MEGLIVRADASKEIGTGHVMRCLALAQRWRDAGGKVTFVTACLPAALQSRLDAECMSTAYLPAASPGEDGLERDAMQTAELARKSGASWVVIDGYVFDSAYQKSIKSHGIKTLFIDDNGHCSHYYSDIILNQNLHADKMFYEKREPETTLLLGTKYALLRREFWRWQGWNRSIPENGKRILVTLGGSDPDNVTLKVINALKGLNSPDLEAVVLVGGSNPYYETLQEAAADSAINMRLERDVNDMPKMLSWADVGITSGGTTVWEMAFMGLPCMIMCIADNQIGLAKRLGEMGAAVNQGWHECLSERDVSLQVISLLGDRKKRADMSRGLQQLVDGEGVDRVLMHLEERSLRLRRAREEDCERIWRMACDAEARAASFSTQPIPWERHMQWFHDKMSDRDCFLFLAQDIEDNYIGQVRFDVKEDRAVISINIAKDMRRKGYGKQLVQMAVKELFHLSPVRSVHAFVKQNNERSIMTFRGAGFELEGNEMVGDHIALHFKKNQMRK